ncbi:glycosyltransferase family 4 protein [Candidatus Parvarchaeota archaeon]|nr:glycosyltransferase family 4 protein [Candidatus Parvarchaeota archaeon]
MDVLFLGWEFPPSSVGGLGTHSYELVKALAKKGVRVTVILPGSTYREVPGVEIIGLGYNARSIYSSRKVGPRVYGNIFDDMERYANGVVEICRNKKFDIIHANDWLTAKAGIMLKQILHKPLILTMHSTEYDRTAGNPWPLILDEEKKAVSSADIVIAVSERLKQEIAQTYGIRESEIMVIHNAIDSSRFEPVHASRRNKIILYVGRLSPQKGVDNLIKAFKIVSGRDDEALLYIVGDGSELPKLVHMAIDLGVADKVRFFGRIPDDDIEYMYSAASIFVMPSVSEPFGITALEAVASMTPTIISKQSGVSEVIKNVFKVDFWDSKAMADIILGIIKYPGVKEVMPREAYREITPITWDHVSEMFIAVYNRITSKA